MNALWQILGAVAVLAVLVLLFLRWALVRRRRHPLDTCGDGVVVGWAGKDERVSDVNGG